MSRKNAREGAMKLLYQIDSNKDFSDEGLNKGLEIYLKNFTFDELEEKYILESVKGVTENLETIDTYIKDNLDSWTIDRLAKIDLSVLRISIYEILYREDIPTEVSINEAIEIVKKYSGSDSFKFVNGVLGGFVKSLEE